MDLRFWKKHKVLPIPVEVQEAAAKGAALLDTKRQGWWQLIKPESLDLLHPFNCVLGQVFGGYVRGLNFLDWRMEINVEDYGFCPSLQPGAPELLRRAWVAEAEERRVAARDAA